MPTAQELAASIGPTGKVQKSLTGGDTLYTVVQIRPSSPGAIRIQWGEHESNFTVSPGLSAWLGQCAATRKSLAGTSAMYVPALARRESATDPSKVRFQVPGPKLSREWGAVFVAFCPTVWKTLGQ